MLTRCPHCETTFRVSPEQLKLRQGKVRCGACHGVFDALDRLTDEPTVVAVPTPAPAPAVPEPPIAGESPLEEGAEPELVEIAMPETESEPAAHEAEPSPEPASSPEPVPEPPLPEPAPEPAPASEAVEASQVESRLPQDGANAMRPWTLGMLGLAFLAVLQSMLLFRVELAVMAPGLRPVLEAACAPFGCSVPLPQKPELVGIESSDLAPGEHGRLLLSAALRNRAPFVQAYPHLELTLTDARDEAVLRKVLTPADFLPAGMAVAEGFAAQGEVPVKLTLDAGDAPAVGYRLYLFYP